MKDMKVIKRKEDKKDLEMQVVGRFSHQMQRGDDAWINDYVLKVCKTSISINPNLSKELGLNDESRIFFAKKDDYMSIAAFSGLISGKLGYKIQRKSTAGTFTCSLKLKDKEIKEGVYIAESVQNISGIDWYELTHIEEN